MLNNSHYQIGTDPVTGHQIVQKITHVSLGDVQVLQNPDTGILEITERPKSVAKPARIRFEAEGGLRRVYAGRDFDGVKEGTKGGLVGWDVSFSNSGSSWIDDDSTVVGRFSIGGQVRIYACKLEGSGDLQGAGSLLRVNTGANVSLSIRDHVELTEVTIDGRGTATFSGGVEVGQSQLHVNRDEHLNVVGGCIHQAELYKTHETLSYPTRWGWLSAYRDLQGQLSIRVGCQHVGDWDEIRHQASMYRISPVEREMLEHFIAMVSAAQKEWTPPPMPAKSEPVEAGDFKAMAANARQAAEGLMVADQPESVNATEPF